MGCLRKFKCKGTSRKVCASMSTIFYALIILLAVPKQRVLRTYTMGIAVHGTLNKIIKYKVRYLTNE